MSSRRRAWFAAGALVGAGLAVVVLAGTAVAATATDGDDVAGKLDVAELRGSRDAENLLHVTIKTHDPWTKKALEASSPNRLLLYLDTDLDGSKDCTGRIVRPSGATDLVLNLTCGPNHYEPLPVTKAGGTAVKVTVPLDVFVDPADDLALAARSKYQNSGACSSTCTDRVKDHGWLTVPP